MKNSKFNKKNIILIIWGLLFSIILIVLLSMLLLSLKLKTPKFETNQGQEQEQKTYNDILNTIDKEVEELTNDNEQKELEQYKKELEKLEQKEKEAINSEYKKNSILKELAQQEQYKEKIIYWGDSKIVNCVELYDTRTGYLIKSIHYNTDGTKHYIYDFENDKLKTQTYYHPDGTIKNKIKF